MEQLLDRFGEDSVLFVTALFVGAVFGGAAQHSRFCLRSATIEFSTRVWGSSLSIWLVAFCTAVLGVQAMIAFGLLDVSEARQLAATGSLSGAIIGGLLFGIGMILARGCASRLLVLSATGNLRAFGVGWNLHDCTNLIRGCSNFFGHVYGPFGRYADGSGK